MLWLPPPLLLGIVLMEDIGRAGYGCEEG